MNRKLVMGAVAGLAAIGLAVGGTTYAAYSDFGDVNQNSVAAGFLKLDLGANGQGQASFNFGGMAPGAPGGYGTGTGRQLWIASNDGQSVPRANLYVTLHNLVGTAAPCSTSNGKAAGETASGISGCGAGQSGTPAQGNLSRVLTFQGYYYPSVTDPAACAALNNGNGTYPSDRIAFFASGRGDLAGVAGGAGTTFAVLATSNNGLSASAPAGTLPTLPAGDTLLALNPGQGACIGLAALWYSSSATSGTPSAPTDNAAQGDSLTFDAHFDLEQDLTQNLTPTQP